MVGISRILEVVLLGCTRYPFQPVSWTAECHVSVMRSMDSNSYIIDVFGVLTLEGQIFYPASLWSELTSSAF
jgi:hypothetical protein